MAPFAVGSALAAGLGTPTGLTPNASGSTTDAAQQQKDPVLEWDAIAGATRYRVELSKNENWGSSDLIALPNAGVSISPSLALPQPLPHGEYWWRVRAENGSGASAWSNDAQVYRGWLDAPTLGPDPGSDATIDWNPNVATAAWRFSWTAIPDASSYELEVSTSPDFPPTGTVQQDKTQTSVECLTTHTTFTPYGSVFNKDTNVDDCDFSKLISGPFFWRVRGVDDSVDGFVATAGQDSLLCAGLPHDGTDGAGTTADALGTPSSGSQDCSQWSAAGTIGTPSGGSGNFTRADLGNAAPVAALSCTTNCADMPEIRWSPVAVNSSITAGTEYASSYLVAIADDPSFQTIERKYRTPFLTLTPRDQFPDYTAGDGYYVSVQACNNTDVVPAGEGVCGTPAVMHFTKKSLPVDGLTATAVPGGERFVWNDLLSRYATALTSPGLPAVEAENYTVQVTDASDTDFAAPVFTATVDRSCDDANVTGCYHPGVSTGAGKAELVAHVADGTYIWRVVPMDLSGNLLRASATPSVTVDTTAPVFRLTDANGHADNAPLHIRASEPVSGVSGTSLTVVSVAGGVTVAGALAPTSPTTWTFTPDGLFVPGERYTLAVTSAIHDGAGNLAVVAGSPVRISGRVDDKNGAWHYSSGWKRISSSSASGGTFAHGASGSTATVKVVGSSIAVYGCKAPKLGKMRVSVDGVVKAAPSLAQSFTSCGVLIWKGSITSNAVHTLKVTAVNGPVDLDRAIVS